MARTALSWSSDELAAAANLSRRTVSRFENHGMGSDVVIAVIRRTLERQGIRFRRSGRRFGLLLPPDLGVTSRAELAGALA